MKFKIVITLLLILFFATRLYKIDRVPVAAYWDEASIGYNAYSILKIGKDEWGNIFPIHLKAFGEYKLPIYIYSVVPFIAIFGLNIFSVRLPSVIFSSLTILITILLTKKI